MSASPMMCLATSVLLLAGCSDSTTPLSAFVGQPLTGRVEADARGKVSVYLYPRLPEHDPAADGCLQWSDAVEASFNGVAVSRIERGGPYPGGDCYGLQANASYAAPGGQPQPGEHALPEATRDGVLELREGDTVLRMEVRDLYVPLPGPVWDGTPLQLRAGEEVFVAWSPASADLTEVVPRIVLQEGFAGTDASAAPMPARQAVGGLWVGLPAGMAPGRYFLLFTGDARRQVTACSGPSRCEMLDSGFWFNLVSADGSVKRPLQLEVLP
jgi:hypothetical protein